jgi:hypothetical protein
VIILHLIVVSVTCGPWLLRRGRNKPTRSDAFGELFKALASVYESASAMKPEWHARWRERDGDSVPSKYDFGNALAVSAARDMRYAIVLLQRNRWKSVVQPLFAEYDREAWSNFVSVSANISVTLLTIGEEYIDLLFEDERDWIESAVEQFDEASRYRTMSARAEMPMERLIAEATYLPVYIAIQLSDRLLDRLRFEAGKLN